ncbi:DNA cytosine methyltransferase [Gordonia sp. ABSL11-1]|uniref:DNA cytosine methyltransferase n=1 Tax=Gordonia sp. ABSL11-1 TaxID=3053924 RepID=UPI002573EA41|nr:DNA cytosine methyltransferase [Gordonia sp. ABSL11-1]MDL9944200.1 DNA cytosine methyltransferase [Gordonia sp. ABSL11-1]
MTLTLTDLFCGAGGSSTGAIQVPGISVRIASNHWDLAVETHNTNHPDADHLCADLSQISPRYFPRTDILWASPECTNHSVAKGRKREAAQPDLFGEMLPDAAAERSRATMWDVPRFAEHHQYDAVIVENVVDAFNWVPFRAWLMAMEALGYDHHIVMLNSMHAQTLGQGAPQSRDRMYVVFWRHGNQRPELERVTRPDAVCPDCGPVKAMQSFKKADGRWGRYRAQYVYRCPSVKCRNQIVEPLFRPAAEIIDWTLEGLRIGDRTKPLAAKTMARIQAGIDRYWGPTILEAAGNTYDAANPRHPGHGRPDGHMRVWPTGDPLRTVHTTMSKALAIPVEGRDGKRAAPVSQPARTMTTRNETGLAFIAELRGGGSKHRPVSDPLCTVTASGNHHGLVTTYYGKGGAQSTDEALPTVTTVEKHALLMRNNSSRSGPGAEHSTPVTEAARTITTSGHQSLLDADRPTVDIEDVRFRMLEPREIVAAMDFPGEYVVLGNRREQVRMAGNAVTPPAARDLVGVVAESLGVVA